MEILPILEYPDPRLLTRAETVVKFDESLAVLCQNMAQTMYHARGVGLAATQVNIHQRVVVIDVSESRDQVKFFINPEIIASSGVKIGEEGCLSIPGYFDKVERAEQVTVKAQDIQGKHFTEDATELLAVCIQHEIDHLNGILFIHHLSRLKQSRLRAKFNKRERQTVA